MNTTPPLSMPANEEMEACLVSCLLQNPREVEHIVRQSAPPSMFFFGAKAIVLEASLDLISRKVPLTFPGLCEKLTKDGLMDEVGGKESLSSLWGGVVAAGEAEFYAERVRSYFMLRKTIQQADRLKAAAMAHQADWDEVLKVKDEVMMNLSHTGKEKDVVSFAEAAGIWIDDQERRAEMYDKQAISLCVENIEKSVGKIFPGELVTIGAETSGGKTVWAMQMAIGNAMQGIPTLVFSLEMPTAQLMDRKFANMARISMGEFRHRNLSERAQEAISATLMRSGSLPIYFNQNRRITLPGILSMCRRMKATKDIKLIVIDYLQLVKLSDVRGKTRYLDVAEIVQELKYLALELDVVIVAPIQLNDEGRAREASDIEMSSDFIFIIKPGPEGYKENGFAYVKKARQGKRDYQIPIELEFEYMTIRPRTHVSEDEPPAKSKKVRNW